MSRKRRGRRYSLGRCVECGGPLVLVGDCELIGLRAVCLMANIATRGADDAGGHS